MATIQGNLVENADGYTATASWLNVTEADSGSAINMSNDPDRTVQVVGDFTTGGEITMQGSNDGTEWASLHDPQGNAIVLSDASVKLIAENTVYIRPTATAGTAVAMDVIVQGVR